MNASAKKHLDKAAGFVAKGEGFFHKAAKEIVAAQEADPALTQSEIGKWFGKSRQWTNQLISWHSSDSALASPWVGTGREKAASHTRTILRDAPLEQVEQIIAALPAERQQAIAGAAGSAYHKARQDYRETERSLTPAQRKEREAVGDQLAGPAKKALAGFTTLGIVGHLEQALEEFRELNADGPIRKTQLNAIRVELEMLVEEYQVAAAMLGLDADLEMQS